MPPSSAAPTLPRRVPRRAGPDGGPRLGLGLGAPSGGPGPDDHDAGRPGPRAERGHDGPGDHRPAGHQAPADDEGGVLDFDLDANEKVWIIVGALVAVALLLLVLTIVYWRHTKPDRSEAADTTQRPGEPQGGEAPAQGRAARTPSADDDAEP